MPAYGWDIYESVSSLPYSRILNRDIYLRILFLQTVLLIYSMIEVKWLSIVNRQLKLMNYTTKHCRYHNDAEYRRVSYIAVECGVDRI